MDLGKALFWFRVGQGGFVFKAVMVLGLLAIAFVFYASNNAEKKQKEEINAQGVMSLAKDPSGKPIFDLNTNSGYGTKPFIAAVWKQNFVVSGVPTTVVYSDVEIPDSTDKRRDKAPSNLRTYSDLLSSSCLPNLQTALNERKSKLNAILGEAVSMDQQQLSKMRSNQSSELNLLSKERVEDLVIKICGPKIFPEWGFIGGNGYHADVDASFVGDSCKSGSCGDCLVVDSLNQPIGSCEMKPFTFLDASNSNVFEANPVTPLPFRAQK